MSDQIALAWMHELNGEGANIYKQRSPTSTEIIDLTGVNSLTCLVFMVWTDLIVSLSFSITFEQKFLL